jgi:hypothetical protein
MYTVKVKERRQNRVNDRVLIIGLVLCVSVEDYSNFLDGSGIKSGSMALVDDKQWV